MNQTERNIRIAQATAKMTDKRPMIYVSDRQAEIDRTRAGGAEMTEDQIERAVERKTDNLDARFMRDGSTMTQAEYDAQSAAISRWADNEYRFVTRAT